MIAHRRRRRDRVGPPTLAERGAALVEFAFLVPLLALFAFGTLELGFQWKYAHEAVGGSRAGARVGAGLGNDPTTDYYILATIRSSLDSAGTLEKLRKVIVYKANTQGDPATSCLSATSPTGNCQVYNSSMINSTLSATHFHATTGCYTGGTANSPLQGWCPSSRNVTQTTADYIGVRIVLQSASITRMFPTYTMTRDSVMRMEP
ncbi:MAG TPA: TadE family protein [Iamia sp.]